MAGLDAGQELQNLQASALHLWDEAGRKAAKVVRSCHTHRGTGEGPRQPELKPQHGHHDLDFNPVHALLLAMDGITKGFRGIQSGISHELQGLLLASHHHHSSSLPPSPSSSARRRSQGLSSKRSMRGSRPGDSSFMASVGVGSAGEECSRSQFVIAPVGEGSGLCFVAAAGGNGFQVTARSGVRVRVGRAGGGLRMVAAKEGEDGEQSSGEGSAEAARASVVVAEAARSTSRVGVSKNALAGGLAGALVSVSLYPVDTIKTIVQAERGAGRDLGRIMAKVVAEYGHAGLYRGLGSNLVTATPISAIYASVYEAVKGGLLPHMPQKYHSVAHCTAGAMASVATSFVFTPSECVKQRMQITSQFSGSWPCFLGILRSEGLPTLYAGWGAVLARNIPNSIIKFLTYETLKGLALKHDKGRHLPHWQALAIGACSGVASSFCTTPFDVVKTRLQAQLPGQPPLYSGVADCLRKIVADEGIGGLYRGVGPRLFIYASQGAIFFASYEVLKRILHATSPSSDLLLPAEPAKGSSPKPPLRGSAAAAATVTSS